MGGRKCKLRKERGVPSWGPVGAQLWRRSHPREGGSMDGEFQEPSAGLVPGLEGVTC